MEGSSGGGMVAARLSPDDDSVTGTVVSGGLIQTAV
jgi:hypothetical protein